MKNLKKVLSVLLVVAMLAATMVPAFAAETATISADAKICADIGMLIGEGSDGVTADYTKTAPTRIQAAIMLLRLKGLAADAAKFDSKDNFADVKGDEWFAPYTAYLKANPLVGFVGVEDGKFAAEELITAQQYYKVVLTALGYVADKDYAYADTIKFAAEKGLKLVADVAAYTVNDLAIATVEALKATVKDGTKNLATVLVEAKAIDEAKAIAAGIYTKPVVGAITAKAVGAKKFEVAFNKEIDASKLTVTVKKGASSYGIDKVEAAADKKSVVVTISNPITKGEYEISVAGVEEKDLTAKVTTEAEKVAKIEFLSENAVLDTINDFSKVSVSYKIFNQYNEDITSKKWSNVTFYASKGTKSESSGKIVLTSTDPLFTLGEKFTMTATFVDTDTATSIYASQIYTVSLMAQVAEIKVVELYNADGDGLDINKTYSDFKLIVEAKDQYGSTIPYGNLANGLIIQSTDKSVVDVAENFEQVTINGSKKTAISLKDPAGDKKAGKANIMFVSKALPATTTFEVTVKDGVKVDTLSLQSPDFPVAGEKVKIPFTAVDQFGNEITKLSTLLAMNELTVSGDTNTENVTARFEQDAVTGKPVLVLDATRVTEKKTLYITGTTPTYKFVNFNVSLQAPATLESISGINSSYKTNILKGNTADFKYDQVVIRDSYGRTISKDDAVSKFGFGTNYRYAISTSNNDKVAFGGTTTDYYDVTNSVYYINNSVFPKFSAAAKGSSTVKLTLQKKDGSAWKDLSEYSFTVATVEKKDLASYTVSTIASVYADKSAFSDGSHATSVTVEGVLANGKKVAIPNSTDNYVVSTSGPIEFVGGKIQSTDVNAEDADATYTVTIFGANGAESITNATIVSDDKPVAKTISLFATSDKIATYASYVKESDTVFSINAGSVATVADAKNVAKNVVKVVDQYGKTFPASFLDTVIISDVKDADGKSVSNVTDATALAAGYQAKVTVIKNGQVFQATIAVK